MAGYLRYAVRADLFHNEAIGTGAWNAVQWYRAAAANNRTIFVRDLRCRNRSADTRCPFTLFREGGDVRIDGEISPAILKCAALFVHCADEKGEGWAVVHSPPKPAGGHSRTSMDCGKGSAAR